MSLSITLWIFLSFYKVFAFNFFKARKSSQKMENSMAIFTIFSMAIFTISAIFTIFFVLILCTCCAKTFYVLHKKHMWHPKEKLMFIVAQKRNTSWQKIIPIEYKYMLYWLKRFCVIQKVLWRCTKIKVSFCLNGAP